MKLFQRSEGQMDNGISPERAGGCTFAPEESAVADRGLTLYAVIVRRSNIRRRKHFDLLSAASNDRHLSVALALSLISPVCLRPEQLYKPSQFSVLICLVIFRSLNLPLISSRSRNHDSRQPKRKGS